MALSAHQDALGSPAGGATLDEAKLAHYSQATNLCRIIAEDGTLPSLLRRPKQRRPDRGMNG